MVLFGWVAARRDHGGCVFIDLRDRGGITQIVFEPHVNAEAHTLAGELRNEFCVGISGIVQARGGTRTPTWPPGTSRFAPIGSPSFRARRRPPSRSATTPPTRPSA